MKITLEDELNAKNGIDPFAPKITRADLTYSPLCKDLKDVLYTGDLSVKENRENLAKCIDNYLPKNENTRLDVGNKRKTSN